MTNSQIQPLIGYKVRDWIPIGVSAALLFYYLDPLSYLTPLMSLIFLINFFIVGGLLWWADGYEREPGRTILWSILWGGFVAITITGLITPGESFLLLAAVIEEAAKLLGLFWIFKRGSIHSATDALVMGGFIGLGFTIFEDFTYSAGAEDAVEILIYRGIFSVFAHTLFSGIGAAIMYILWKKLHGGGIVLGFIFSYMIHYLWNISLGFDLLSLSPLIYIVVYAFWPPVALVVTCILVRRREVEHIRRNGDLAVSGGIVSPDILEQILNRTARRQQLKGVWSISRRNAYKRGLSTDARRILELDHSTVASQEIASSDYFSNEDDPWS